MMNRKTVRGCLAALLGLVSHAQAENYALQTFTKIQLTDKFWSEAATFGDINRDGRNDAVAGPYWYEGPDFKKAHEFYPATRAFKLRKADGSEVAIAGFDGALGSGGHTFSDNYFVKVYDFNGDQWPDILVAGYANLTPEGMLPIPNRPKVTAFWYENPGKPGLAGQAVWKRHLIAEEVDNQSLAFEDVFKNGRPVLLCMFGGQGGYSQGQAGYLEPDPQDPYAKWIFQPISLKSDEFQWYTHGLGYGDLNGDGRNDVLHSDGWWEQPHILTKDRVWDYHAYPFNIISPGQIKQSSWGGWGPMRVAVLYDVSADGLPKAQSVYGGSHMSVDDLNADGLPDVVTSIIAHGYGLVWWEQLRARDGKEPQFRRHVITNRHASENKYGVKLTQMQSVALFDMDGDGLKDIVTGKRFWGHGKKGDPEPNAPAVLYWFKQVRLPDKSVEFVPYLIDDNSGASTQITAGDINGDSWPDIVVANKKGAFVFLQRVREVSKEQWEKAQPRVLYAGERLL